MKSKVILIILFLCPAVCLLGQNAEIDSLKQLLTTTTSNRTKADILSEISKSSYQYSFDDAFKYANQILDLEKGKKKTYITAKGLQTKSVLYERLNHEDSSRQCCIRAYEILKKQNEPYLMAVIIHDLGVLTVHQGDPIRAIKYYEEALTYLNPETEQHKEFYAKILIDIALSYDRLNDRSKTINLFLEASDILEDYEVITLKGRRNTKILMYDYLSYFHRLAEDYEKAQYYCDKGMALANKLNDYHHKAGLQQNQTIIYEKTGQYDKAIEAGLVYLKYAKASKSNHYIPWSNIIQARIYLQNSMPNKALEHINYLDTLNINQKGPLLNLKTDYYNLIGQYDKALSYAQELYELSISKPGYDLAKEGAKKASDMYKKLGDHKNAYLYHTYFHAASDSLAAQNNNYELSTQKKLFEFEKEKDLIQEKAQSRIKRQTSITIAIVIISILFGSLALLFYKSNQVLNQKNTTIEQQNTELNALYNHKNQLFANITHELQTPLTLILAPVRKLLTNKRLDTDTHTSISQISLHVSSLQQITKQVLDLAKSELEQLQIVNTRFLLSDFIEFLRVDFRSIARYRNIQFHVNSIMEDDFELSTDGQKLLTVVKNLLSNAFKFTPSKGTITVSIHQDEANQLNISVQDSGKGINDKDISLIFNRYFQTSEKKEVVEGGMGIGLAICKEYIELLSGKIQVKSTEGKGSIFTIKFPPKLSNLPVDEKASQDFISYLTGFTTKDESIFGKKSTQPTAEENTNKNLPLLVVEDNISMCQHLNVILSPQFDVTFAPHGKKALEILAQDGYEPHLIISDLMMPEMDGFKLVQHLKSNPASKDIPVLMLTARDNVEDKLDAFRIGVDDYLTKPFLEEELLAHANLLINNYQERKDYQEELTQIEEQSTTKVYEMPEEDLEWLNQLKEVVLRNIEFSNFSINNLADEMAVSYTHIFREVKRLTGFTPYQYVKEVRLQEAKQMLESKRFRTVKAVAHKVGQNNVKHFSITFKKRFGKTPSEYLR